MAFLEEVVTLLLAICVLQVASYQKDKVVFVFSVSWSQSSNRQVWNFTYPKHKCSFLLVYLSIKLNFVLYYCTCHVSHSFLVLPLFFFFFHIWQLPRVWWLASLGSFSRLLRKVLFKASHTCFFFKSFFLFFLLF